MQQIKLPELNVKKIKSGKFEKLIPEFYKLKKVIENNPWHNKESVFNHTLSVLNNLEKIIQNSKKEIKQALNKIVDKNSRRTLLYIAALLHDIGKEETITNLGGGIKGCPGHEKKGAQKTEKILKRFNFSKKEFKIIMDIVRNHGTIHDIIGLGVQEYKNFKKKFTDIYLELILLAFADTIGSYLEKSKPAEFRYRINFYKKELTSLLFLD